MLLSNFLFDLIYFAGQSRLQSSATDWFARMVAGSFILLAGVSLTLSRARQGSEGQDSLAAPPGRNFVKVLKRGLTLMGLGCLVSVATWIAAGNQMVVFGVLHLIGAGIILAYPFLGRPRLSLAVGLLVWSATCYISEIQLDHSWFVWLGLKPHNFSSVDYAPLIPWFGPMLLGVFLGESCYPQGRPRWSSRGGSLSWPLRPLAWCGRHSLIIYFVHQPLLLGGLALSRKWW